MPALVDELLAEGLLDDEALALYTPDDLAAMEQLLTQAFEAPERPGLLPHQVPPPLPWNLWLMLGGRGAGKTQGCSIAFKDHIDGPP